MATTKQRDAARQNIKKAQAAWRGMTHRQHALAQPEGRARARPGSVGTGEYYRVVVRPEQDFTSFRTQDVGKPGGIERIAGRRSSGSWATQAWLISKAKAHAWDGTLLPDDDEARDLFKQLREQPVHVKGDIYRAKDRRNVPEAEKPTLPQRQARSANIKKAQAAWRAMHTHAAA